MKFVKFALAGQERYGRLNGAVVELLPEAFDPWAGSDLETFRHIKAVQVLPIDELSFLPPMKSNGKIICVGLNYRDHAAEGGHAIPETPAIFLRLARSVVGHREDLIKPVESDRFDYEAELAVIIGKHIRRASAETALDAVFGYTCFNDGSLRDYQRRSTQWTLGKNFDRSGALGPAITTADSLPLGASNLSVCCRLNGKVMQNGNTEEMIFSVAAIIAVISEVMTLEPGDVICTGTPAGVGFARHPEVFMQPGDICEIEIEGIGILRNIIAANENH